MATSSTGKVRIDYDDCGVMATVLFEPVGDHTLESRFDRIGSVTDQRLIDSNDVRRAAENFVVSMGADAEIRQYREVTLQKECPGCGNAPLSRYIETLRSPTKAPVMPLYVCGRCGTKGYHLTDEYLGNLVHGNMSMFDASELSELGKDEKAFMEELRAYIIRIFASQRIMNIK
jgi:hypothetical protein